ncbi:MAG TPA: hypothetical protein VE666_12495 [Mycobacterium sp.]|nr:hypothetical protein [Mycobacterium sp.]
MRDAVRGKTVPALAVADRLVHFVRQSTSVPLSAREVAVTTATSLDLLREQP